LQAPPATKILVFVAASRQQGTNVGCTCHSQPKFLFLLPLRGNKMLFRAGACPLRYIFHHITFAAPRSFFLSRFTKRLLFGRLKITSGAILGRGNACGAENIAHLWVFCPLTVVI
jgi:hypothetical protein